LKGREFAKKLLEIQPRIHFFIGFFVHIFVAPKESETKILFPLDVKLLPLTPKKTTIDYG